VRPDGVVVIPPAFDQGLGLSEVIEDFTGEEFIPQFAIEAFAVSILPRRSRCDVERLYADVAEPFAQGDGDKLRTVIRSDMLWRTVLHEQFTQRIENITRVEPPLNSDSETLTRILIDHAEHAEDLSIMGAILDEVIRPDMALVLRSEPNTRAIIQPEPSAFGLLQPFTSPDAIHPLLIHMPAIASQQGSDPAITIPAVSRGEFDNSVCQRLLVTARCLRLTLSRAVLADHTASTAL